MFRKPSAPQRGARTRLSAAAVGALMLPLTVGAQPTSSALSQTIDIQGQLVRRSLSSMTQDVAAAPAAVTVLTRKDIDRMSLSTYGDLFRRQSGAFVNEYGIGLVAYEIKFRGFAGGHNKDLAFFLDGVPLNVTGSQHTNGYADLAQLIPELIDRVEIVRGPFSVAAGNHAVGGSVRLTTDRDIGSFVKVDIDSFGRVRALPVWSGGAGAGRLLLAADLTKGQGYQDRTDLQRGNLLARYQLRLGGGAAALRLQAYDADADSSGYIDLFRLRAGEIRQRDALSKGIGDVKRQQNLVASFASDDLEGSQGWSSGWQAAAYATRDDRRRYSNFNLLTPIGADVPLPSSERDRLSQLGLELRKATLVQGLGRPFQWLVGLQLNDERVNALRFTATSSRNILSDAAVVSDREVQTRTAALLSEVQIAPWTGTKVSLGLRWDRFDFDVGLGPLDDLLRPDGPTRFSSSKDLFSPKLGVAVSLSDRLDLFFNVARGLKSPYAFGDFNRFETVEVTPLRSVELGMAFQSETMRWRANVYTTRVSRESLFDGANNFIGAAATDRDGFDAEWRWRPIRSTQIYLNYGRVFAELKGRPGDARIPTVPDWTAALGAEIDSAWAGHRFAWSVSSELIGPQPLRGPIRETTRFARSTVRVGWTPAELPQTLLAMQLVHYSNTLQETIFDFNGATRYGVSPKPKLKGLLSAQLRF